MRLTLRTLLSWKDGMLEPEVGRDLAARVEASADARALLERIDEVVARPTLAAPAPDAPGFAAAANTTAEYLDNVLPVERLGEFERVCFASEAQLAETAAVHEILAELSRDPAGPLDAAASKRLLAAARAGTGDEWRGSVAPRPAARRAEIVATPRRSTRPPTSAWLLVAAAALLLAALVGVLGWSLTKAGRARSVAREAAARKAGVAAPAVATRDPVPAPAAPRPVESAAAATPSASPVPPPAAAATPRPEEPPAPPIANVESTPVAVPEVETSDSLPPAAAAAVAPADPPAPEPAPAAAPVTAAVDQPAPQVDQRVPQGDALAIAAPAVARTPAVAVPPAAPVAGAAAVPAVVVVGREIVLFRPADDRAAAWLAGTNATPLDPPVDLVAPPFCRPTLEVNGMRIALEPGTRAVLGTDGAGGPQLEVVFGAAVIAGPGRLGIVAGDLAGAITTGPAAPVGVEVALRRPPGAGADATQRVARIMPTAGRIDWQPAVSAAGDRGIAAGQALEWRSATAGEPLIVDAGPPPAWLTGSGVAAAWERRAADALANALASGGAAVPTLEELAGHRRVENRVAAAAALAMIGEFADLARLLVADGPAALPESLWDRLDAVAVQPTLARGERAAEAFDTAVAAHAPAGAADAVTRFARGTGDDELAAGAPADLIAALESPHLVVRRYALRNLFDVAGPSPGDRLRYRADRAPEELREGAAWWRAQFEQGRIRRAATEGATDR